MTGRMIGLGFEDVIAPPPSARFDEVSADAIAITVGRVDWTAFPWADHEDAWSPRVVDSGRDFVAEAIALAGPREVSLIVDVMVQRWIEREPSIAGVDAFGEHSIEFASITALNGVVGSRLVDLVVAVAAYGPSAVTLTELFLDRWTFGDDDLANYCAFSNQSDWPRLWSGAIDQEHASVGAWRSDAVARLVARCAAAIPTELHVEVRAQWDGPTQRDGQDYEALLAVCDRLIIWGYFALAARDPAALEKLARQSPAGSTISIGLWTPSGHMRPTDLRRALDFAARGGAAQIEVVPASLMTDELWRTLHVSWNPPR